MEHASSGCSRRGLQDHDLQHGRSFTEIRTERAVAIEFSALQAGLCHTVLTAGRVVHGTRLSVWPFSDVRWILVSSDSAWTGVQTNLLVALRDVAGKQTAIQ